MAWKRFTVLGVATALVLLALAAGVDAFHDPFVDRGADGTVEAESYYTYEPFCEGGERVETVDDSAASGGSYVRVPAELCSVHYGVAGEDFRPGDIRVKGSHSFAYCVVVDLNFLSADSTGTFSIHLGKASWQTCFADGQKTWKTLSPTEEPFDVRQGDTVELTYHIDSTEGPSWSDAYANLNVDWWGSQDVS